MPYQSIKRAIVVPNYRQPRPGAESEERFEYLDDVLHTIAENYTRLAREVIDCHNQIQVYQFVVAPAAGTLAVVWTAPFFDANYSAFGLPDWNTTIWYSAKTTLGLTFNFGTAAPGGGGNLLVLAIR